MGKIKHGHSLLGSFIAIVIAAVSLGCGGGSSSVAGPTPTPTPMPTPTPTPNPVAGIATISPNSAPAGALAFTLNIHGSNFMPASMVEWDGSSRTTTFVSSSQLQAQIMAADLATPGKVTVTVVNPAPGGGTSNAATFTVAPDTIAFLSRRALDGGNAANLNLASNVWAMNADGSGQTPLTKLTANGAFSKSFAWSLDGSKIAFASDRALDGSNSVNTNGTDNIWVVNADGSGVTPLTNVTAAGTVSASPVWSPDGSKIAFWSGRALDGSNNVNTNNTDNIWVVNADGSGATPLTKLTAANAGSFFPVWSADGSKIAFSSTRSLDGSNNSNTAENIWVMNADGSGATPLTKLTAVGANSFEAVWSPDGSKIAFESQRALDGSNNTNTNTNTPNIWLVNADGSGATPLTLLTAIGADSSTPGWSPNGSKVVFSSQRALDGSNNANTNNNLNIWVVNADGSGATPLTKLTAADSETPVWSPDGSKIIFASRRALDGSNTLNTNTTLNIWVVNADGSGATPLTRLTASGADCLVPGQP